MGPLHECTHAARTHTATARPALSTNGHTRAHTHVGEKRPPRRCSCSTTSASGSGHAATPKPADSASAPEDGETQLAGQAVGPRSAAAWGHGTTRSLWRRSRPTPTAHRPPMQDVLDAEGAAGARPPHCCNPYQRHVAAVRKRAALSSSADQALTSNAGATVRRRCGSQGRMAGQARRCRAAVVLLLAARGCRPLGRTGLSSVKLWRE